MGIENLFEDRLEDLAAAKFLFPVNSWRKSVVIRLLECLSRRKRRGAVIMRYREIHLCSTDRQFPYPFHFVSLGYHCRYLGVFPRLQISIIDAIAYGRQASVFRRLSFLSRSAASIV